MKKTTLSIFVLLALLATLFAPATLAEAPAYSGSITTDEGSYSYTLDSDGNLKITGTGKLNDYAFSEGYLPDRTSPCPIDFKSIEVSDGITSIGIGAFGWNYGLESVVLGKDVTEIGEMVFADCGNLSSVTLSDGLTSIGEEAFYSCASLNSITIPDGVTSIDEEAFSWCRSLTSISLPAGLTSIGDAAFNACYSLSDIYFDGTKSQWMAVSIGESNEKLHGADTHCSDGDIVYNLSWTLVDGVFTFDGIGHLTVKFPSMSSITKVVISDGLLSMSSDCFVYCYNLECFEVDENNPAFCAVDGVLYNKDKTRLHAYPNGKEGALTLPATVKAIAEYALSGSDWLTGITLPEGLEEIGMAAFFNCSSLETITIPASVSFIGGDAFTGCSSLESINVASGNDTYYSVDGVVFNKTEKSLDIFPGGRGGTYTVPEGITSIAMSAFYRNEGLTEVTLPEGILRTDTDAFGYCENLETVHLPVSIEYIGTGTFGNCDKLTDVYYAGSKEQWADVDISGNNNALTWAIVHCSDGDLENSEITGFIGEEVEYVLTKDGKLTISGPGEWNNWAFSDSTLVTEAVLESGVTEVGHGSFSFCQNMEKITIPASVELVKYNAFYYCEKLTDVSYEGTIAEWEALMEASASYDPELSYDISDSEGLGWATIHCSDGDIEPLYNRPGEGGGDDDEGGSTEPTRFYQLPAGLLEIEAEAFMGVIAETVEIPDGCTTIGEAAFKNCSSLQLIFVPSSVTSIADDAFDGCSENLTFAVTGVCEAFRYANKHGFYVEIISEA